MIVMHLSCSFKIRSNAYMTYGCVALVELCLLVSKTHNLDLGTFGY